jgi:hypothetical protein
VSDYQQDFLDLVKEYGEHKLKEGALFERLQHAARMLGILTGEDEEFLEAEGQVRQKRAYRKRSSGESALQLMEFVNERDTVTTADAKKALGEGWNTVRIGNAFRSLMESGQVIRIGHGVYQRASKDKEPLKGLRSA